MTSITTGVIGAVIATGTIRVGIENIPGNIGPVKNFINHHQVIPVVGEDHMTEDQEALQDLVTRGLVVKRLSRELKTKVQGVNQVLQGLKTKGQEAILDRASKVESMAKIKERLAKSLGVRGSKAIHQKRISHQLS
jgi:hypothetical protein